MLINKLTTQNDVLGVALSASLARNDVITQNIAHADTPGYKAKRLDFEASLKTALQGYNVATKEGLNLRNVVANVRLHNPSFNYRLDENNVDMDIEMVDLYQNSVRYDTMVNCVQMNSKRLSLVLSGRS